MESPQCAASEGGSQAGDPLGDLFFVLVHSRVTANVRERWSADGLAMRVPWASEQTFWRQQPDAVEEEVATDGSYLDDSLFLQAWPTPELAYEGLRSGIRIVHDVMTAYGL